VTEHRQPDDERGGEPAGQASARRGHDVAVPDAAEGQRRDHGGYAALVLQREGRGSSG
jgi:hypothetical protein